MWIFVSCFPQEGVAFLRVPHFTCQTSIFSPWEPNSFDSSRQMRDDRLQFSSDKIWKSGWLKMFKSIQRVFLEQPLRLRWVHLSKEEFAGKTKNAQIWFLICERKVKRPIMIVVRRDFSLFTHPINSSGTHHKENNSIHAASQLFFLSKNSIVFIGIHLSRIFSPYQKKKKKPQWN